MNRYICFDLHEFLFVYYTACEARKATRKIRKLTGHGPSIKEELEEELEDGATLINRVSLSILRKEDSLRKQILSQPPTQKITLNPVNPNPTDPSGMRFSYYLPAGDEVGLFSQLTVNDIKYFKQFALNAGGQRIAEMDHRFIKIMQKYYNLEANVVPLFPFIYGLYKMQLQYLEIICDMHNGNHEVWRTYDPEKSNNAEIILLHVNFHLCNSGPSNNALFSTCVYHSMFTQQTYMNIFDLSTSNDFSTISPYLTRGILLKSSRFSPNTLIFQEKLTKIVVEIPCVLRVDDVSLYQITDRPDQINESLCIMHYDSYRCKNDMSFLEHLSDQEPEEFTMAFISNNVLAYQNGVCGAIWIG